MRLLLRGIARWAIVWLITMEKLINSLKNTHILTNNSLLALLRKEIDAFEEEHLQRPQSGFVISEYNRQTVIHMMNCDIAQEEQLDRQSVLSLIRILQDYLNCYMKEQPEGHKWIIISCLYLTFIMKEPMHPQDIAHWERDSGGQIFYCPAYSFEEGSTCLYCVCKPQI